MTKPRRDLSNPDPQLVRFARVLRRERIAAGLSQEALGELAGVSQASISVLEKGEREPGILTVAGIARALQIRPSELIRELS